MRNGSSMLAMIRDAQSGTRSPGRAVFSGPPPQALQILNSDHKAAIEFLVENLDDIRFNRYTTLNLHALLAEDLLSNRKGEGRLRVLPISIGRSAYTPILPGPVLGELFEMVLDNAGRIADPFKQSFFVLVHLPYLQPFINVNKRTARLLCNLPLLKANLCPLTFIGLPRKAWIEGVFGVYELNRVELLRDVYLHAYRKSINEYLTLNRDLMTAGWTLNTFANTLVRSTPRFCLLFSIADIVV